MTKKTLSNYSKNIFQKIHSLFHIHSTFDTTLKKPTKLSLFQCTFLWKYLLTHLSEDFFLDFAFQTNLNDKRTSGSVCISGWVGPKRQNYGEQEHHLKNGWFIFDAKNVVDKNKPYLYATTNIGGASNLRLG